MTHRLPDLSWPSATREPHVPRKILELHQGMSHADYGAGSLRTAVPSPHSPNQNLLLAALPAAEFERLAPHLELVPLPIGEMLYLPGVQIRHAYFPTTAVVSLHCAMESGESADSAEVGNEGVVGIALFMGGDTMPNSAAVRTAGHGYRLAGRLLKQEFDRAGQLQSLLLRYTQALITQMIQTAACNRHHSVEQQLCRWLLLTLDRVHSRELVMTQELVASMLGVRREAITTAAGKLRRAGVISYRRGHIAVLERSGLESRACECYAAFKKGLSRVMSDVQCGQDLPSPDYRHAPIELRKATASKPPIPATLTTWRRYAPDGRRTAATRVSSGNSARLSPA